MPFGKYKGEPLSAIPTNYLDWVLGLDDLFVDTRVAILKHLRTRADWHGMDDDDWTVP